MRRMKGLAAGALLAVAACSTAEEREHDDLMDRIEQQIRLPERAYNFKRYARYYAFGPNGQVYVEYVVPIDAEQQNGFYDLPAGARRWVDDYRNLPAISDGGCMVVYAEFDPAAGTMGVPRCNGQG